MFLSINNISKTYSSKNSIVNALEDINLDVKKGEFICLLGPSGCGKSTLLNIIAGLDASNSGNIVLNNREVKTPDSDRVVVFQESALFPWLRVIDNVAFGMKMAEVPKKERIEKAMYYLRMVHLSGFENHFIHELSGGMKQRVAIARAFSMDCKILLMDEPFSALDNHTKFVLQRELEKLWMETNKTILFVTHSTEEAVLLGDRIVLMSSRPGRIKSIYKISNDRPRNMMDSSLLNIVNEIKDHLREEGENGQKSAGKMEGNIKKNSFLRSLASYLGISL